MMVSNIPAHPRYPRTSLDLCLLHVLPRHRVAPNDLLQRGSGEILLAWLFLGVVFS